MFTWQTCQRKANSIHVSYYWEFIRTLLFTRVQIRSVFRFVQLYYKCTRVNALMPQSIPTGYIPPRENFFERANPGHLGNFFGLIPCPMAKNDGRIPRGWGKIFPNSKKLLCIKLSKVLKKWRRRLRDSKTTRKSLNAPALIFNLSNKYIHI